MNRAFNIASAAVALNGLDKAETSLFSKDKDTFKTLAQIATENGCILEACQSNSESELVNIIQNKSETTDYMIINPGAFTHTSIALRDVLLAVDVPFIEVHISNIFSREEFRKNSYFSDIAQGTISGLGFKGYELALLSAIDYLKKK